MIAKNSSPVKAMQQNLSTIPPSILDWFQQNRRDLPWRRTYHPYHVWISEIMLQQTQMERGVSYFNQWISRFPTLKEIAEADEDEILKLWEGLGYYNRARNIHKTARILVREHNAKLPASYKDLLKLPGIGKYTAGAIMSIAFNQKYPVVDANVERVFARVFDIATPIKEKKTYNLIWHKAANLIPENQARDFNQALMELGALVCSPKKPNCQVCPLLSNCLARYRGMEEERPIPGNGKKPIQIEMATGILIHNGMIFIQKRLQNDVWANLWEFPGGRLEKNETPEQALVREFYEETEFEITNLNHIKSLKHSYTFHRVTLHAYLCKLANSSDEPKLHAAQDFRWLPANELTQYPFPSVHRKLSDYLLKENIVDDFVA